MQVRTKNPDSSHSIDVSHCLLVPAEMVHDDEGISSIYDTFALLPEGSLIEEIFKKQPLDTAKKELLFKNCFKFNRTAWLDQLIQQYFYERVIAKQSGTDDCKYLERKILFEVFASLFSKKTNVVESAVPASDSVSVRALKFIESNLFAEMDSKAIAQQIGASLSTLFREFKKLTGQNPYAYIKTRRLEEAMLLLKKGGYAVSEVALLVGYENFGAFSEAFKTKYKKSPSFFLKARV